MSFLRLSKSDARDALELLVQKYEIQRRDVESSSSNYTETEARGEFIDPFLVLLGWDVHNDGGASQSQRDVVLEHAADPNTYIVGRPDYRLRVRGRDRLPVEAKKPSVRLSASAKSSIQARSYGWSLSLPAAMLTNFAETVIFDARQTPTEGQGADESVIPGCRISVDDYLLKFDVLWEYLAFENVANDAAFNSTHNYTAPPRGTSPFDKTFLDHFRAWRLALSNDIAANNSDLGPAEVGRRTQQLLNALLFIRVCEDRDIWIYQRLLGFARNETVLEAFKEADRVFNAGLFTVLRTTTVNPQVLRTVIAELYWPKTKFAFGVMRPDVLAELYEQYLSERIEIGPNRSVTLVQKPELTHSNGVVPTPQFIVDVLTDSALAKHLDVPGMISPDLRIVDPACGSGVFLLAVFQRLLAHIDKEQDSTLVSRSRLATKHLFGVDIDAEAVEVTRLSLLLSVLGEARVDVRRDVGLLPDLAKNIQVGNAVVSTDFDTWFPDVAAVPDRRAAVAQFSWSDAFPQVHNEGGFSLVLANPPYVRIQQLQSYVPDQLAYFQDLRSKYKSREGSFDLYMIFIERAISLLRTSGELAMIVPNAFTTAVSGGSVREELGQRLTRLVYFGVNQVFPGRLTYTALVFAGASSTDSAVLEIVQDLEAWKTGSPGPLSEMKKTELTGSPWTIASAARQAIYAKMESNAIAVLGDKRVAHIYVGVQTSRDALYFLTPHAHQPDPDLVAFSDEVGISWSIERAIVRPSILDRTLRPYDLSPNPDRVVIFPYKMVAGMGKTQTRAIPYSLSEMQRDFPQALDYFQAHRETLERRSVSPDPGTAFWAFGRSQNLTRMGTPKVIIRTMSLTPQYASDPDGIVVPGGGNGGPYTLMMVPDDGLYPQNVIIAIASHPAADSFVASRGKAYSGAYLIHTKGTMKDIPIPRLVERDVQHIDRCVQEIQGITMNLRIETDALLRTSLGQRSANLRADIESIISSAYGLTAEDLEVIAG